MVKRSSMYAGLLLLLMVGVPLVVEGQNHPLKYFRLFLKNTLTGEVEPCFSRDWSMTDLNSVSEVYDSYKDRNNFVFGFDGEDDWEMHDCGGSTGFNLDLTVWDCALDIIRNADAQGQAVWEMKLDMAVCDHNLQTGLVPDPYVLVRFFDDREYGKTELSAAHFNLQYERITNAGNFRNMIRYESNYTARFGPPNFDANLMELNINFRRNGALDFEVQSRVPVKNTFNYCVDSQRCLEAIFAGMDAPPWICPIDACPPGFRPYKEDLCYLSLVTEQIFGGGGMNRYRMQIPAFNNTIRRIRGTRDCLDRQVDPTFCYNRVNTLVENCFRYTEQNYAYS